MFEILADFDENYQIQFKFPTVFELSQLLFIIVYVAHICACGFHLIINYISQEVDTWLVKSALVDSSWIEKYVASLYFSFTTMITVGFGDIVPISILERVYVIVIQVVSCGVFAYAISKIGSKKNQSINQASTLESHQSHHTFLSSRIRYIQRNRQEELGVQVRGGVAGWLADCFGDN